MNNVNDNRNIKQEIIDFSKHKFKEQGIKKTTVEYIASELDIAKGTFYYYFDTKKELINMIVDRDIKNLKHKIEEVTLYHTVDSKKSLIKVIILILDYCNDSIYEINSFYQKMIIDSLIRSVPQIISDFIKTSFKNHSDINTSFDYLAELIVCIIVVVYNKSKQINDQQKKDLGFVFIDVLEAILKIKFREEDINVFSTYLLQTSEKK